MQKQEQSLLSKAKKHFIAIATGIALLTGVITNLDYLISLFRPETSNLDVQVKLIEDVDNYQNANIEFSVINNGSKPEIINTITFIVDSVEIRARDSFFESSHTYDVDISQLTNKDDVLKHPVSQLVKPKDADKFNLSLACPNLNGNTGKWRFSIFMTTNLGELSLGKFPKQSDQKPFITLTK